MRPILCLALLASVVVIPACASHSQTASDESQARPARTDMRRLSPQEIEEARSQNMMSMYDLILVRRNAWLRPAMNIMARGGTDVSVWMDRVRIGGPEALRSISLTMVESARYLTASEAQAELGLANLGGAIIIYSRR